MKKLQVLFAITLLIILSGCRGREMPMHNEVQAQKKPHKIKAKSKPYLHISVTDKPKVKKETKKHQIKRVIKKTKVSQKKIADKENLFVKKAKIDVPSVATQPLPIAYTLEKFTQDSKKHIQTTPTKKSDELVSNIPLSGKSFSGGGLVDHLDMGEIRIGKSSDYTSIIFDSYIYAGKNKLSTEKSNTSGTYLFRYEPSKNHIIAFLDGYNDFSALKENQEKLFKESKVVKNIYVVKYLGNDGVKFIIQLRKKVRVNIFDVKNPGRIIVNLFPK